MESNLKKHWDSAYNNDITKLGWYEEDPNSTLQLFKKCNLSKDARILDVGVGTSTWIDELIQLGFYNLIASDISSTALEKLQKRLGSKKEKVQWINDDLTNPNLLLEIDPVDLWHDRAVLHFFTNVEDQNTYFSLVKKLIKANGYVLISTFNVEGATKCSGLNVLRYDKELLIDKLGPEFKLIEYFNYMYTMPSGDTRPYIYTLFKKINL